MFGRGEFVYSRHDGLQSLFMSLFKASLLTSSETGAGSSPSTTTSTEGYGGVIGLGISIAPLNPGVNLILFILIKF